MKKFKLRDYQADDLKRINKEIKAGHKRVLYSLMTAGGKTIVLHEQVSRWLRKGLRGCVLVHTRALLNQTCAAFSDIPHGIIAGGIKPDPDKKLQICMVQSLARRGGKAFDFIVVDEAHHATASTWARMLADSPEAITLGVTATPFRHDNRGLGQAGFTTLVEGPEVSWLTEQGFLSPVEYYAPTDIDMTGVKKVGGDYEKKESSRRANKPTITGSAVEHYKRHTNGQRALVFCADIKHVLSVTKKFKKAGLNAAFIHGKMATDEREDVLLQFAESKDMILVSCELIGEGLDVPAVACVILLRPTASLVRFIQQVGRGLRVAEGKKHVVVLDHVGNIRLGHPHVRREVDLNGVEKKAKGLDENSPKSYLRTCPKCKRVETADVLVCSTCGHKFGEFKKDGARQVDGSLVRLFATEQELEMRQWKARRGHVYGVMFCGNPYWLHKDERVASLMLSSIKSLISQAVQRRPSHEEIMACINKHKTKRDPVVVTRRFNNGSTYSFCSIEAKPYMLGSENAISDYVADGLRFMFLENNESWPSQEKIKTTIKKLKLHGAHLLKSKNAHVPLGLTEIISNKDGATEYYINILKPRYLSRKKPIANTARDYLLKFYESNNYEWPPKSEVPALVKKALEHARSTVE